MLKKMSVSLLLAFSVCATAAFSENITAPSLDHIAPEGLSVEQAKQLLLVVLKHENYKVNKPGMFIDGNLKNAQGQPSHKGYLDFSLGYDDPKSGATEYAGLFSVSVMTGDIWETNLCKNFKFPSLHKLQEAIMTQTKHSLQDERSERVALGCSNS